MARTLDLGAPNPDLRNSPIAWEFLEDEEWTAPAVEEQPGCYFNGAAYSEGTLIRSEDLVLECRQGFWIPVVQGDPENP